MIYFGENNEYILCECEICKSEMYVEKNSVSEADAYAYHVYTPIKCQCGAIDEYINRAKKSCHSIKHELSDLSDLLHKQFNISNKISEITAELSKKFTFPSFGQLILKDILFSLKVFFILLAAAIGVELFLFIISSLMFIIGMLFQMPDLSRMGNELFYNVNIFKGQGGSLLSKFGMASSYTPLDTSVADSEIILGYIPYAIAGVAIIIFYVFLALLLVRVLINVARLTFFASKVVNRKIKINQRREEYRRQLDELSVIYQNLSDKIEDFTIIPNDYKTIRAAEAIFRIFANNRADNIREAVNLFHEEDFRHRMIEYTKGMYTEAKQTRRYTKALYMLTSDDNIRVEVSDIREEQNDYENMKVGDMLTSAFSKIKPKNSSNSNSSKIKKTSVVVQSIPQQNKIETEQNEKGDSAEYSETSEIIEFAEVAETLEAVETEKSEKIDLNEIFDDAPQ